MIRRTDEARVSSASAEAESFIAHLDSGDSTEALLEFLENPPAGLASIDEQRAITLVPVALGHIARRGDPVALQALLKLGDPATGALQKAILDNRAPESVLGPMIDRTLHGLALSQAPAAERLVADIDAGLVSAASTGFRVAAGSGMDVIAELKRPSTTPRAPEESTRSVDPAQFVDFAGLDWRNHVQAFGLDRGFMQESLAIINNRIGQDTGTALDYACCFELHDGNHAVDFGTTNDGLNSITTQAELDAVMAVPLARIKVVFSIDYCNGFATNIIGCGRIRGANIVVERLLDERQMGALLAHEYGHNTRLDHDTDEENIMFASLGNSNHRLTGAQCESYHNPDPAAQGDPIDIGACTDDDLDNVHDRVDNCVGSSNNDQENSDTDPLGDVCDNCVDVYNPVQSESDGDGLGNACDNCVNNFNPGQLNTDNDEFGDICDLDDDNDGFFDPFDNCILDYNPTQNDNDGDGPGDACDPDDDNDAIIDTADNCQWVQNGGQENADGDDFGNVCDNCVFTFNNDQSDADADGLGDVCDNCAAVANPGQENWDNDQLGDACESHCGNTEYGGTLTSSFGGTTGNLHRITWSPGGEQWFDVMRGDLDVLRASAGDFTAAIMAVGGDGSGGVGCMANDTAASEVLDPWANPQPGHGLFYVLRPVDDCGDGGSYDTGTASQSDSRDAEINLSGRSCR